MDREPLGRGWVMFLGDILFVLGVAAIGVPLAASVAVELVFGALVLVAGAAHLVFVFRARRIGKAGLELLVGALYAVGGVLMLLFPVMGVLALAVVLAALLIGVGVARIAFAMQTRHAPGTVWRAVGGGLSVLLGILIWAGWPETGLWAIGLLLGIELVFAGITALFIGVSPEYRTLTQGL